MTPVEYNVIREAIRWWRKHAWRWTETQHLEQPEVGMDTREQRRLARAVAGYVLKRRAATALHRNDNYKNK